MTYPIPGFCSATGTELFEVSCPVDKPIAKPSFKGTKAAAAGYKIYVAVNSTGVQYIGCTCTTIGNRLSQGYLRRKNPKHGYHGYKWLPEEGAMLETMHLYVFHLTGLPHPAPNKDATLANKTVAERIEAELVYAIRAATGLWPLSQHEIHFHNFTGCDGKNDELAKLTTSIACQLFEQLSLPLLRPGITFEA